MSTTTCSRLHTSSNTAKASQYDKTPSSPVEATFTFKVGGKKVGSVNGGGHRIGSSESSDPVESDCSDEAEEEGNNSNTRIWQTKKSPTITTESIKAKSAKSTIKHGDLNVAGNKDDDDNANEDNDEDEDDDDDDDDNEDEDDEDDDENDSEQNGDGGEKVNNRADEESDKQEADDGNETDDEEDDKTEDSSSVDTARGIRKYDLDDFQIIKTVGTGTFGRVCLCCDRITKKYCAMKILAMADVIRLKQIEHVKNERNILREIKHPFVISLEWSTKDDCCLYMIFEYICGGELFTYLRNTGRFNSQTSNFYASEIVSSLEYLHSLQIVYRDLKPENLLINRDGHLKITDFGFAKKLRDRTWTLCGTPEYLAPEIIQSKGHNKAVDWWALGVLIYEMLVGYPPFYDENPFGIYEKILSGKIEWPRHMDPIAKDLVKKLLTNDRTKRLGNMKNGADDVKRHRWFKNLNWNDVYNKKLKPPLIPEVAFDGDTSNFDDYPEKDWKPARAVDQREIQMFNDF